MNNNDTVLENNKSRKRCCDKPLMVYTRTVGYYSNVNAFNVGKKQEFLERNPYKI